MYLVQQVIFTYDISNIHFLGGETSSFKTIDELKTAVKNAKDYFKMPYKLSVKRDVQIFDKDAQGNNKPGIESLLYANVHPVKIGSEFINMIVANELMYPKDVRTILHQRYNSTLNFDTGRKWDEKKPVRFDGVTEDTRYGLRDSKTGAPTQYTLRYVNCSHLNDRDIVVDENLNQIWPEKTGNMPNALTQLLVKTKEVIH